MNNKKFTFPLIVILAFSFFALMPLPGDSFVHGQTLSRDVRDVFEGLLDDLDDDLRAKFQKALDDDTPVVEFSKEEFKRFRSSPSNPFEGIQGIDPETIEESVQLRFELPSLRNRPVNNNERQTRMRLRALRPVVASVAASTVQIKIKNRPLAMGVIVDSDGYIVTKASEIQLKPGEDLVCELVDKKQFEAKQIRVDKINDVALLKISARGLPAVDWKKTQPTPGAFVVTVGHQAQAASLGTYSNVPRSTAKGNQALLGVRPEAIPAGVRITGIEPDSAAGLAGLIDGDVVTKFDGIPMKDVIDLVNQVRMNSKGDTVNIEFLRNGRASQTQAVLGGQTISSARAKRFKMMNRLGAVLSKRSDDFPVVFQHDCPLFPEQCGGPIVDLEGQVLGLNIARNGRASTLAIPSSHMQTIVDDLLRASVAQRTR